MKRILLCSLVITGVAAAANAQQDAFSKNITYSGYGEVYYGLQLTNTQSHEQPGFIYNHKRNNEVNLNLAFVKAAFARQRLRANLALMSGTYIQYNMAHEPVWAQFVLEANAGIKLSDRHNLWLDAGIMPSHIGFENAQGTENLTLSRSIVAENSPYYETGAKLSYTGPDKKLNFALLLLNGWQTVQRVQGQYTPSFGFQANYVVHKNIELNYSNFWGRTQADSLKINRLYHNFYTRIQTSPKTKLILGFDLGQDYSSATGKSVFWYTPVAILQYQWSRKYQMAGRLEYFNDPHNATVSTDGNIAFQTLGSSVNVDYHFLKYATFRLEGKLYSATNSIFTDSHKHPTSRSLMILSALCIKL